MSDHILRLPGAPCKSCWGAVSKALSTLHGLEAFQVRANPDPSIPGGIVELSLKENSSLSIQDVIKQIEDIGFEAIEEPTKPQNESLQEVKSDASINTDLKSNNHLKRFLVSFGIGMPLLVLAALGITLPLYAMWAIASISLSAVLYTGWEVFEAGIKNVIGTGIPTMHTLFSISVLTASAVSIGALFFPMLPFEFASALLILSSHHIGKYIEAKMKKSITAKNEFSSRLPKTVTRIIRNKDVSIRYEEININDINIGDRIELKQGEYLPVDGNLFSNSATFKKTIYNGDLLPETEFKEARLYAGTQLISETAELMVTSDVSNSSLAYWEAQLRNAQQSKSKALIEKIVDRISQYFIPAVLAVSALTFIIALPFYGAMVALHSTIAILVGACPCTLGFITPLATHVGREKSRELGAIINNPESLEIGSQIDVIVVDLNGTLTKGIPSIKEMRYAAQQTEQERLESLKAIALLEGNVKTQHPIGQALLAFVQTHEKAMLLDLKLESSPSDKENVCGVEGMINNNQYLLGNANFMHDHNISVNDHPNRQFLVKNGSIFSYFDVYDPLRRDALQTVRGLQAQGIAVVLASGASLNTVQTHAKALSIDKFHANLRSHEKEALIKQYQTQGLKVAMIGDGLNDAVALQTADIGIALANADELNKNNADVLIHKNALLPACHFFKNCKQATNVIKQNFTISLVYNIVVMTLSMFVAQVVGSLAAAIMALSMGLQSLLILANTYRLKQTPIVNSELACKQSKERELVIPITLSAKQPSNRDIMKQLLEEKTSYIFIPIKPEGLGNLSNTNKTTTFNLKSPEL